jgi:SpoVK/Ycf46/Vps4 family AAA+-type ATPase
MDEETKEQIQMLVQLSRIKPVATSQSLLKILRMSGILFYGPPGTGKTLLCKAIANQSQSRMLSLSSASLQECHLGEAEKKISAAFSLARKLVPCIIFIDEIDALFYRRSGNDKSWERSFINQFLIEMDGLTRQTDGIAPLVIVATNRPGDLDDGFLRRLPHKVLFTLPAITERKRILEGFLHKDDVGPQLNLDDLAERTRSFSGSDLRSLCEHAALAWAVEQTKTQPDQALEELRVCLDDRHFKQALTKTAPTVSPDSIKPLKLFARRFNTQSVHVSKFLLFDLAVLIPPLETYQHHS